MGHVVTNPARHILGGGIEGEMVVDASVVKVGLDEVLDVMEVDNHTLGIEFLGAAEDGDDAVVAVELSASTLVRERKAMGVTDLDGFGYDVQKKVKN